MEDEIAEMDKFDLDAVSTEQYDWQCATWTVNTKQ
nr:hypothetical protein Itr_chr13CG12550 [Ipomoea trifida]GMC71381.1 hypothetical protein Iba_chr03bCG2230 [Ipomoea batatas]GMD85031.1 hypothetical protein Iba_chr14aCG20400 [Ipomoea batatas]GMD96323.1 hypothetical protein Iba_chr15bCG3680 [Ipomoea batatas]